MPLSVNVSEVRYQNAKIISNISFDITSGEIVAILGRNGSGKSSLLKSIVGVHSNCDISVSLKGLSFLCPEPHILKEKGVVYLPQTNPVFDTLSIRDNLKAAVLNQPAKMSRAIELLPERIRYRLNENASVLSGGEKQLLALAMVLASEPEIILLDEPCASLSPEATQEILNHIHSIATENQVGVIVVEQKVHEILAIADKALIIADGGLAYLGSTREIPDNLRVEYEN